MKQIFIKLHRILGSVLSLVFLMWFLSGFVMIYSGFPHADRKKAFEKQEYLSKYKDRISPIISDTVSLRQLSLEMHHRRPVYHCKSQLIDAETLTPLGTFNESALDSLVLADYSTAFKKKKIINDFDSWIPWAHFSRHFPIHKYYLDDDEKTVLYVSEKTGKIVQETTEKLRWFARLGAIPHWFYFKSLRLKKDLWADFIIWLSGIGSILCITGLIVGFYRMRKWRILKKKGLLKFSPYKKPWYKCHHIIGLTFGVFVFTFVFSGMLSMMSIPSWLVPIDKNANYRKIWQESSTDFSQFKLPVKVLLTHKDFSDTKRIEWRQINEVPYYLVFKKYRKPVLVDARKTTSKLCQKAFSLEEIKNIAAQKFNEYDYTIEELSAYDGYYKNRNNPVAKIQFNDANKSWLYIDMNNPDFTYSSNRSSRLRRWLYRGLHTFNFPFLHETDWLRKLILIMLSVFGTIVSGTAVVLSYKYLRRQIKKKRRKN